jgi:hypothetical protein
MVINEKERDREGDAINVILFRNYFLSIILGLSVTKRCPPMYSDHFSRVGKHAVRNVCWHTGSRCRSAGTFDAPRADRKGKTP